MNSNWSYSLETPNLGQIQWILELCHLEIWRMTLENNRTPLLGIIKLYASFHHHMWIQTGVAVQKGLGCDLCDLDLWPLTLAFCMDLTLVLGDNSWNFLDDTMMGIQSKRCERQTDRRTENTIHIAAWSQLKNIMPSGIVHPVVCSISFNSLALIL